MKVLLPLLSILLVSPPVLAWEILLTKDGTRTEGDIKQKEFLLEDHSGVEIIIPRVAVDKLQAEPGRMVATLKDGTVVSGELLSKVEIEDGLIMRRYKASSIQRIDFDNYIAPESGETYRSCPIRLSLPAEEVLLSTTSATSTIMSQLVTCQDLKIVNVVFKRRGNLSAGKDASVTARVTVSVPPGADQLAHLSLAVVQEETVLAVNRETATFDEGEMNVLLLKLEIPGEKWVPDGPEPRFRIQLVNQDEDQGVERGGFYWWFTIPVHL